MLTDKQLQEFKRLYQEHFGKDISDVYATEIADQFLDLLKVVYKPTKKEEYNEFE